MARQWFDPGQAQGIEFQHRCLVEKTDAMQVGDSLMDRRQYAALNFPGRLRRHCKSPLPAIRIEPHAAFAICIST